jgi:uncharacterized membrane protein YfcA
MLTFTEVEPQLIPAISLCCNVVVVAGSTIRFWRAGLIDWSATLPSLLLSASFAFLGGLIPLNETTLLNILGISLLLAASILLLPQQRLPYWSVPNAAVLALSGAIGFLAGLSGIGGGIFIAPVLHLIRWAEAKRIAAFASLYILTNSITGLAGQLLKGGVEAFAEPAALFWPLLLAVVVGGQIGSTFGIKLLSPDWLRRLTAILVGYAAIRLILPSL